MDTDQLQDALLVADTGVEYQGKNVIPADAQITEGDEEGHAQEGGFVCSELQTIFQHDVAQFMTSVFLPKAQQIENEVEQLQYEAGQVTSKAEAEKTGLQEELLRLSNMVQAFQANISQFLRFG